MKSRIIEILSSFLETDYLSLVTNWEVAKQKGDTEAGSATVKIFANENEFKNYHETNRNSG